MKLLITTVILKNILIDFYNKVVIRENRIGEEKELMELKEKGNL